MEQLLDAGDKRFQVLYMFIPLKNPAMKTECLDLVIWQGSQTQLAILSKIEALLTS